MKKNLKGKIFPFFWKYLYVLKGASFLLTLGLLSGKTRAKIGDIAEYFGWKNPTKSYPTILPTFDSKEIFSSGVSMEIYDPLGRDGNVSLLELLVINTLVRKISAKAIFEIGTFDGRTALNMAGNTGSDAKVYTLDLPNNEMETAKRNPLGDGKFVGKTTVGFKYRGTAVEKKIVELKGDSAIFDYSPYEKSMNFVFIDGAHSYEYVVSDTENALAMLKESGIIIWHDYRASCEGVTRALNEHYASGGVFKNLRWISGTNLVALLPDGFLKNQNSSQNLP